MRFRLSIAAAVLTASSAFADEPTVCYIKRDPTGDFVPDKIERFGADPATSAQIAKLINLDNASVARCIRKHIEREGGGTIGRSGIMYAIRISPAGKVTQASVIREENINDAMLMSCIARTLCEWRFEVQAEGAERLVQVPPYILRGTLKPARPTANTFH